MVAIFRTNFDTVLQCTGRHFDCTHCSCDLTEFRKEIIHFVFTENLFEKFDFPRFRFTVADADSVLAFQKDLNFPPNQNVKLFTVVI